MSGLESLKFENNLEKCNTQVSSRLGIFVYSIYNTVVRLTFALSRQYLLVYSTFGLFYEEVKRHQTFVGIPLILKL